MTANTAAASELVETLKDADQETAQDILDGELERPEPDQRKTVLNAAQERVEELAPVADAPQGEVLTEGIPENEGWAQLLDGDGEPVLVDGHPVRTELVT